MSCVLRKALTNCITVCKFAFPSLMGNTFEGITPLLLAEKGRDGAGLEMRQKYSIQKYSTFSCRAGYFPAFP